MSHSSVRIIKGSASDGLTFPEVVNVNQVEMAKYGISLCKYGLLKYRDLLEQIDWRLRGFRLILSFARLQLPAEPALEGQHVSGAVGSG